MGLSAMVSPNRVQNHPHFSPLAAAAAAATTTTTTTQGSIYNLAYNEVQNQLGHLAKPLNRMNLDELLKTVINTDNKNNNITHDNYQQQLLAVATTTATSSVKNVSSPSQSSLSSSSSTSSPAPFNFNQKPPPEVWRDILHQDQLNVGGTSNEAFVQTTLEDFLIRHGGFDVDVVNPQPLASIDPQPAEWLQQFPLHDQHLPVTTPPLLPNSIVDVGYSDNQLLPSMPMVVAPSSAIQAATPERKRRLSDEMMEKTIERRQKRMIKNRESAARSRAKKQAHTTSLEHRVAQLKAANQILMKEKELEALFPLDPTNPKHQLRRSSSAKF